MTRIIVGLSVIAIAIPLAVVIVLALLPNDPCWVCGGADRECPACGKRRRR